LIGDLTIETINLVVHIGADGILRLELPVGVQNVDLDVVVIYSVKKNADAWEAFIDATYGSLAHDPIQRPEELHDDVRDDIE